MQPVAPPRSQLANMLSRPVASAQEEDWRLLRVKEGKPVLGWTSARSKAVLDEMLQQRRDPSRIEETWEQWMRDHAGWRRADIRFMQNDKGQDGGVDYLQTAWEKKMKSESNLDKVPGNMIRRGAGDDWQFDLYMHQNDMTMQLFEAGIDYHPFVRSETLEVCNAKLLNSNVDSHEGIWTVRFQTWGGPELIYGGLTRHGDKQDASGKQMTHAWLRFKKTVPTTRHGQLCDLLLNACTFFSWFECGEIRRLGSTPLPRCPGGLRTGPDEGSLRPSHKKISDRLYRWTLAAKQTGEGGKDKFYDLAAFTALSASHCVSSVAGIFIPSAQRGETSHSENAVLTSRDTPDPLACASSGPIIPRPSEKGVRQSVAPSSPDPQPVVPMSQVDISMHGAAAGDVQHWAAAGASTYPPTHAPASQKHPPKIVGVAELQRIAGKQRVSLELDRRAVTSQSSQPSPAGDLCPNANPHPPPGRDPGWNTHPASTITIPPSPPPGPPPGWSLPGPPPGAPPDWNTDTSSTSTGPPSPPLGPLPGDQVRPPPAATMASQEGMRQPVAPAWQGPQQPGIQGDAMQPLVAPPGALDAQLPTNQEGDDGKDVEFGPYCPQQMMVVVPAHDSSPGALHPCETIIGRSPAQLPLLSFPERSLQQHMMPDNIDDHDDEGGTAAHAHPDGWCTQGHTQTQVTTPSACHRDSLRA